MSSNITEVVEAQTAVTALATASDAANQIAALNAEASERAKSVALQIGYDGAFSVGALEDEIRFYQRRTVEACLELGKRLLILKELTPHGEFTKRVELLGFSNRTSQRFMQAAAKTAKSANLAVLSTQVASVSAFLELVTHDDDVLEDLSKIDDLDRLSGTEVKALARTLKADLEATEKVLSDKQAQITKLERKLHTKVAAVTDWGEAIAPLCDQAAEAGRKIAQAFTQLAEVRKAACAIETANDAERDRLEQAFAHLALKFGGALAECARLLDSEESLYERSLAAFAPE